MSFDAFPSIVAAHNLRPYNHDQNPRLYVHKNVMWVQYIQWEKAWEACEWMDKAGGRIRQRQTSNGGNQQMLVLYKSSWEGREKLPADISTTRRATLFFSKVSGCDGYIRFKRIIIK